MRPGTVGSSSGRSIEPNAHLAALTYVCRVTTRLSTRRITAGGDHLPALSRFYRACDPFPSSAEILAEVSLEASKAARARKIFPVAAIPTPETGTDNGRPAVESATPAPSASEGSA